MDAQIEQVLEQASLNQMQRRVLLLIVLTVVLEGIDIQIVGIAAPQILAEWNLSNAQFAFALAASLLGMAIGAPMAGALADRLGRRPILIGGVVLLGVSTAWMALAQSVAQIALMRVTAGFGFAAVLTTAPALAAEWMPRRLRQQIAAVVVIGIPLGGMIGAAAGAAVIPLWGWRTAFAVGGSLPLLLACIALFALPESLRFLSLWPNKAKELNLLLRKMGVMPIAKWSARPEAKPMTDRGAEKVGAAHIFSALYRKSTAGLAVAFFSNLAISYAFFSWVPVLLASLGLPMAAAIRGLFYFNLSGALGAVLVSWLFRHVGSRRILVALGTLGVLGSMWLSFVVLAMAARHVSRLEASLIVGLGAVGVATVAGQASLYALGAYLYSTECRASGLGFSGSAGRWGGMASIAAGGVVLGLTSGTSKFLWLIVGLFVMAIGGAMLVDRHWPKPISA